jgi:hypothetical protein
MISDIRKNSNVNIIDAIDNKNLYQSKVSTSSQKTVKS